MAHGNFKNHKKFVKDHKAFSEEQRQARGDRRFKIEDAKRRDTERELRSDFASLTTN